MSYVRKDHKNIYKKSIIAVHINKKKTAINYLSASQLDVWISATSVYHGNTSKDNKRVFFPIYLHQNQIRKKKFKKIKTRKRNSAIYMS